MVLRMQARRFLMARGSAPAGLETSAMHECCAALASDIRLELQGDFHNFSPFEGSVLHAVTDLSVCLPDAARARPLGA